MDIVVIQKPLYYNFEVRPKGKNTVLPPTEGIKTIHQT